MILARSRLVHAQDKPLFYSKKIKQVQEKQIATKNKKGKPTDRQVRQLSLEVMKHPKFVYSQTCKQNNNKQ